MHHNQVLAATHYTSGPVIISYISPSELALFKKQITLTQATKANPLSVKENNLASDIVSFLSLSKMTVPLTTAV